MAVVIGPVGRMPLARFVTTVFAACVIPDAIGIEVPAATLTPVFVVTRIVEAAQSAA
jgi:hypothetical protein